MNLKGQVAIVTGGGRGIGKAIAVSLAEAGAAVSIVSNNPEENEAVCEELQQRGAVAISVIADVTKYDDVARVVKYTEEHLGPIQILINNAGWDKIERFIESSQEEWIKVIDINLIGQMRFCREVLPLMTQRGYGRIINISSDAGRVGTSGQVAYSAAKGAIIAFSKALAREVVKDGLTVNCVAPGPTNTPLYKEVMESNPKLSEALERAIPMRRAGEPEEIAYIVKMLAANEASYITGQTISVSGGLTMV